MVALLFNMIWFFEVALVTRVKRMTRLLFSWIGYLNYIKHLQNKIIFI